MSTGLKAYRKTLHSTFDIKIHIVFVTKYRKEVLTGEHLIYLEEVVKNVVATCNSVLVEFNGETDHIHMIVSIPPRVSVSYIVNILKSVTSRLLRKKYDVFKKEYWGVGIGLWNRSYFAASVGDVNLATIIEYIANQERPT